jgi:hypothetical protein
VTQDNELFSDTDVGVAITSCPRAGKGGPPAKKWDDDCVKKILCKDSAWVIDGINKRAKKVVRASGKWPDEAWDDKSKKWVVDAQGMGGEWDPNTQTLTVQDDASCEEAAVAIYHEATHAGQPATMSSREMEYDAYEKTELWAIKRGLPAQHPSYRTKDKRGNVVPNKAAIKKNVDAQYPGQPEGPPVDTTVGGKPVTVQYQPIDYDPRTNETILAVPGTALPVKRRPPQAGDRVARDLVYTVPPTPVNTKAWKCP